MAEAEAIPSSVAAAQDVIKPPARSRGRPRRKGGPSRTVVPTLLSPITRTDSTQHTPAHDPTDVRPREERSYMEFFPDLDITQQLPIVRSNQRENDALPASGTTSNVPASSQNKTVTEDNSSDSSGTPQTEVSYTLTNGKLPNGSKSPSTTTESVTSEPTEIDLFETVEYDMDEQDEAWLRLLNAERRKENLGSLSTDLFETVMDQIEKEWFDLVKNLPKQSADEPALDSACAICDDGECENSNAIVFCDGCNLAVHQDCYGIPYIPEGQWLCRKCMVSPEIPVSCLFCPNEGGAFKQTNTNKWAHLLCAIWIPEVGVSNSVYMEPIDNIENIPKSRWKLSCYVCRQRTGACIQCDNKHCFTAFHVTCARKAKLYMKMKTHNPHYDGGMLRAYCDKHTPRDYKEHVEVHKTLAVAQRSFGSRVNTISYTLDDSEDEDIYMPSSDEDEKATSRSYKQAKKREQQKLRKSKTRDMNLQPISQLSRSSKAARAHQHQYTSGAPIAPEYIIDKLENLKALRSANHLRRKTQLIITICRYWSLKRESRRGAPLLKRLHLEPWTASSSQTKQTEVEKARKAAAMMGLRADLERVRMLSEQVQKRERHKLERLRKQKAYLEIILFPLEYILKPVLEELME
ncbi:PHD-zinc-finger like domain-containing protein [Umbelopsis sp. PMI_123]|nr:PHD-zinc-finger like domain-containing protein [Umbelopsis sp. PMI_123]